MRDAVQAEKWSAEPFVAEFVQIFAMGFSVFVEMINLRVRPGSAPAHGDG